MNLYLDASALVKRYVAEPGSDTVLDAMDRADGWFICRIGFVETVRAVGLSAGRAVAQTVREEWPAFGVVEVDQSLVEHAAELAITHELRSMDALHLAAALALPREELLLATWDRRLHAAARTEAFELIPDAAPKRLAAILAETPPDAGFAGDLRRMREQDRDAARDPPQT